MWAAQGQKQLLKVFILNLSSWRQNVLLSISLAQASYTIVEDRLGMEHESWTSGHGELRGRLLASAGLSGGQSSCSHRPSAQWWPEPPKPGVAGLSTTASALLLPSALRWHSSPASVLLILPSRPLQHLLSYSLSLALIIHRCTAEWNRKSLWSGPVFTSSRGLSYRLGLYNFLLFG